METTKDDDADVFAPIIWMKRGTRWRIPNDVDGIEMSGIRLKPVYANKITFEILTTLFATDDYWQLVHQQTLL